MRKLHIRFYFLAELVSVHYRHHDITDDQVDMAASQYFQCFYPVHRCLYGEVFLQAFENKGQHTFIVFYQQEGISIHIGRDGRMFVQLDNVFLYGFVVLLFNALHIQRNGQYKNIALLIGVQIDRAFMQGCQRTCQRQTDAYSITGLLFSVHLIERFEYILADFRRNLVSVTGNTNRKAVFSLFPFYQYILAGVLQRIIEQVAQYLGDCFFIYSCPHLLICRF